MPRPAREQPRVAEEESQRVAEASPITRSTPIFFRTSPMGKLRFIPRKEVVFSLGLQQTSSMQIGVEGTNSEPIQVEDQQEVAGVEPEGKAGQEDPVTLHPVGAKTRPMTRSPSK